VNHDEIWYCYHSHLAVRFIVLLLLEAGRSPMTIVASWASILLCHIAFGGQALMLAIHYVYKDVYEIQLYLILLTLDFLLCVFTIKRFNFCIYQEKLLMHQLDQFHILSSFHPNIRQRQFYRYSLKEF